jgi:ankyrin repeat protein
MHRLMLSFWFFNFFSAPFSAASALSRVVSPASIMEQRLLECAKALNAVPPAAGGGTSNAAASSSASSSSGSLAATTSLQQQLRALSALSPSERRAVCQARDSAGRTALHHVSEAGTEWALEAFLRAAAAADSTDAVAAAAPGDSSDGTVASAANPAPSASTVAAVASASAHALAGAQDGQGQTALHLALKRASDQRKSSRSSTTGSVVAAAAASPDAQGHLRCAHLLLDVEEAHQKLLQQQSTAALPSASAAPSNDAAASAGDEQAAKRARVGGDAASSSSSAAVSFDHSAVSSPLSSPSLLTLRDSFGRLPLHWAVTAGSDAILLRCITLGSSAAHGGGSIDTTAASPSSSISSSLVNVATRSGETPLHWACEDGRLAAVDTLLSAGADPTLRNARGEAPLDLCTSSSEEGEACRSALQVWIQQHEAALASAAVAAATSASKTPGAAGSVSASMLAAPRASASSSSSVAGAAGKKKIAIKLKK